MAEKVIRQVIDDIDGSEIPNGAGERVDFALRGVEYRIDLSSANVAKLEKALKLYVDAAMKVSVTGRRRSMKATVGGKSSPEQLAAIRDWARKNGHEVADRGRIKTQIVKAFEAAH